MLEREREKLTIDRLRTELHSHYDLQKGGQPSKSRSSDSASLTSESRRGNSKRNGKLRKKNRGTNDSDSRRGQKGSSDNGGGGEVSSKSGGVKCSICKETGHKWTKCSKQNLPGDGARPNTCPKIVEEDENLAHSESDQLDGICE